MSKVEIKSFSPAAPYTSSAFTEASSLVATIAKSLIANYHPWLMDANIGFLFREEAQKNKGRMILASAMKVPDKLKTLLNLDFLIWISEEDWNKMTSSQREALVDHELCHCVRGSNGFTIRGHDLEEFHDVVERHGLWRNDVYKFYKLAAQGERDQLQLPGMVTNTKTGSVITLNASEASLLETAVEGLKSEEDNTF